ncbi:MAG: BLUF domain-containing protein [Chloroflexi bacterium]|nr:BLUF domain-containing protein [Chloroflexota bacterium]MCC6896958.1 BLUF domain-containing protein [Anaerolineae bacterium]
MGLITLVYVSFATQPLDDNQLKEILAVARENNQKLGITGMLLYRDGFFIQALEGEDTVVNELFDKIAQDPRHKAVLKVYSNAIQQRSFTSWAMGFNKLNDTAPDGMDGYTDFLSNPNTTFFTDQPDRAKVLLRSFQERTYF